MFLGGIHSIIMSIYLLDIFLLHLIHQCRTSSLFLYFFINPFIHLSIHPSVILCLNPPIYLFPPSISAYFLSLSSPINSFTYPSTHLSIYPSTSLSLSSNLSLFSHPLYSASEFLSPFFCVHFHFCSAIHLLG